jgi:NADH-quinone oxidoreductase subunit L
MLAGYFHLTTHAFFKALLFLAAGSAIHAVHTNDLREMGGLARSMRVTAGLFALGALALAGIPPLSGFFSKELVLAALEHHPLALVAGLLTTVLTPYYMFRAFLLAFLGEPRGAGARHAHESGAVMVVPMLVLALLASTGGALLLGFGARTGLDGSFHFGALGALAVGLALTGLVAAWVLHGPRRAAIDALPAPLLAAARSGAVDKLYVAVWRHVVLALAGAVSFFDRYVVDGVMNVVGAAAASAGSALRRVQTGLATDYVFAVFAALLVLAAWGLWGAG